MAYFISAYRQREGTNAATSTKTDAGVDGIAPFVITINWRCRSLMATRSDIEQSLDATRADRSFFGHPRGLATLFFTEMWERFSYYGMRALLILFMTASVENGGLGFPVTKAGAVYGLYTAMVYLLSLPGGWMADRIMGQRRAVLYGGILISAARFLEDPEALSRRVGRTGLGAHYWSASEVAAELAREMR